MKHLTRFSWALLLFAAGLPLAAQTLPPGCYFDPQTETIRCPEPKPFECQAQATATPTIRAEGAAELLAPLTITCTGGTPTPAGSVLPQATLTIAIGPNVNVTSRQLDTSGASEALLLLDEPSLSGQYPCETGSGICTAYGNGSGAGYYGGGTQSPTAPNNRNVFQGFLAGANTIIFRGIPFDPPGQAGSRTFNVQNLRVNASQLQAPPGGGVAVTATVSISGQQVPLTEPTQTLGIARASTRTIVRNAENTLDAPGGVTANTSNAGARVRVATLRLSENAATVLRQRTSASAADMNTAPAPAPQNQASVPYRTETGFYNPAFPSLPGRGNLGVAGLAGSGTRIRATFTQVPGGVTLYVGTANENTASEWARLIAVSADGSGTFEPVPAETGSMAPLAVTNGTATAVWEVLRTDTAATSNLDFPIYASYPAGVRASAMSVDLALAPVSAAPSSSATAPLPRFLSAANPVRLVQFDPGTTVPLPALRATPATLSFTLLQGTNSTAQNVLLEALLSTVPQNVSFTATPGTAFPMQVNPLNGRTPATLAITAGTGNLAPGKYTANITITASGAANSPLLIPVELNVTGRLQITSLSPNTVTAGRPAFDLAIAGAGFANGAQVLLGGQSMTPASLTPSLITLRVPPGAIASPGSVPVQVVNPEGAESNTIPLNVLPAPVLTQLDPGTALPNTAITIAVTGRNFTRDLAIQVNGASVASTFIDATRMNASIPASALPPGAASVNISGLTADGFATNSLPLALQSPLTLDYGPVQAGDRQAAATIRGAGIPTGSRVEATPPGGAATAITPDSVSSTAVAFTLPASLLAQPGAMTIRLLPPGAAASAPLTLTVQPAPGITSLSPSSRPAGSPGFTLTVNGANFLPGSTVQWNSTRLATTGAGVSLSAEVAAALVAARAPVNVSVEGPGGAKSNSMPFEIALPSLPSVTYGGLNVAASGARADATLTLGSGFPSELQVQFTLTFAPDGNLPNDRAIVFTNGQRQISVTIPAGSTAPVQVSFQTGSTAGVVTLTPRFFAGSADVTPAGVSSRSITIGRAAPILAAEIRCLRSSGTQLTITATGITNTREASRATFEFTAASGETLTTSSFPIDTAAMFAGWFNSAIGQQEGGTFLYTQTFNVSPSSSGVASAGLSLTNAAGTSAVRTAQCTQ
ncbi:MAG: IPT/TIG domain-containing protein [Bryobacterales bacterium]|nr:IPT/TIG domain-containing protein [Bryobacterales bacterium]